MEAARSEHNLKQNKPNRKKTQQTADSNPSMSDGKDSFQCDKCGTPFITNPMIRGNRLKKSSHVPSPRHKVDPETNKRLCLCNACGKTYHLAYSFS